MVKTSVLNHVSQYVTEQEGPFCGPFTFDMELPMKKIKVTAILWFVLLSIPLVTYAASHGHGNAHDMQKKHDGMSSDGLMFIVGSMTSKGVKGMAHLKDASEAMTKMGMDTTHHFMIAFVDESTGKQIEGGTVALKVTNPDAKVGEAIKLIGMDGHFGADVVLDMKGEYHFRLGTKLADGKKRKYHFHQVIE